MGLASERKYGRVTTENKTFHEGEPVFLLRAQDPCALKALKAYGEACEDLFGDSDDEQDYQHLEEIGEVSLDFLEWQTENPDKVRAKPGP